MMNDPAIIDEMLRKSQTIAVVGMSDKAWRASHNIGRYLVMQGYRVFPRQSAIAGGSGSQVLSRSRFSPGGGEGRRLVRDRSRGRIPLLDKVPPIAEDVIRLGIPYLWLQEDVINDKAVARATSAGVKCVQDVCIFREHAQRLG